MLREGEHIARASVSSGENNMCAFRDGSRPVGPTCPQVPADRPCCRRTGHLAAAVARLASLSGRPRCSAHAEPPTAPMSSLGSDRVAEERGGWASAEQAMPLMQALGSSSA